MNIWLSSLRIRAHLSWRTGKHLHVLHVLRTCSTCSCPGQQDTTTYAALSGKRFSNEAILFHAFLAITLCSKIMTRCVAWFLTICEQHANWILLTNKSSVNGRGPSLLSAFDLSVSANLMKTKQHVSWLLLSSLHVCPQLAFNTSKYGI